MSFGYTLNRPSASNLRYRINILQQGADDSYGEPVLTPFATGVWADVQDLRGLELIRAQKIAAQATHYVTIRYRPGVLANMQINFDGRTFFIEAVLDEYTPRKVWMALYCRELQAK